MNKKSLLFTFFLVLIAGVYNSHAVEFSTGYWKFGINGFLDMQYRYMGSMPMSGMGGMLMPMNDVSTIEQHSFNLLFDAERDQLRVHVNLKSSHDVDTDEGDEKNLTIQEVYGSYFIRDLLKVRAGRMLSPFGIYNESLYIAPLFASSKLPLMYEMPGNYDPEGASENFMPPNSNLMLFGNFWGDKAEFEYAIHISNGQSLENGDDINKDKGIGARVRAILLSDYKLGFSYYTVENDKNSPGRESLAGVDLEIDFSDKLKWETEYVVDHYDIREDRLSFYSRITAVVADKFSPFITYDYVEDKADNIYKRGMTLYGTGCSYNLSDYVTLKTEYHYHVMGDKDQAPVLAEGTDSFHMLKADIIFVF